jgi:hypothetical protein
MNYTSEDFKQNLKGMLHGNEQVTVKFTKKDGSERTMVCTLNETKIPAEMLPKAKEDGSSTPSFTTDAVRVFDTEKTEWRSFRYDSIKSVKLGVL